VCRIIPALPLLSKPLKHVKTSIVTILLWWNAITFKSFILSLMFDSICPVLIRKGGFITIKSKFLKPTKSSVYAGFAHVLPLFISPVPLLCRIKFIFAKLQYQGTFLTKYVTIESPFSSIELHLLHELIKTTARCRIMKCPLFTVIV
jgi:hypothetical protein